MVYSLQQSTKFLTMLPNLENKEVPGLLTIFSLSSPVGRVTSAPGIPLSTSLISINFKFKAQNKEYKS
ncbi:MAG TPA: hypothetical protein P5052_04265 [Candidatus Paceibacterota bacterium]|nr:hypothetical protein [Candidatus Paceibacterota bacterium]HRZ29922.1 hypothetical protein [Candidatus Paceibacterota bacterium]